jgi:putative transposase
VVLEALNVQRTVKELAGQYQMHPTQIRQWKRQVQGEAKELFVRGRGKGNQEAEAVEANLYEEVGGLENGVRRDKKLPGSIATKRQ